MEGPLSRPPVIHTPRGLGHSEPWPPTCHANERSHCLCPGNIEIPGTLPCFPTYLLYFGFSLRDTGPLCPSQPGTLEGSLVLALCSKSSRPAEPELPRCHRVLADCHQHGPPLPQGPPGLLLSSVHAVPSCAVRLPVTFYPVQARRPGPAPVEEIDRGHRRVTGCRMGGRGGLI